VREANKTHALGRRSQTKRFPIGSNKIAQLLLYFADRVGVPATTDAVGQDARDGGRWEGGKVASGARRNSYDDLVANGDLSLARKRLCSTNMTIFMSVKWGIVNRP
jgi:hypothetical protein